MPRTLVGLVVTAFVLVSVLVCVGPARGHARGVQFGLSRPSGLIHWDVAGTGFLPRRINVRSLAAPDAVFEPIDDPYASKMFFRLNPCYVAPL